MVTSRDDRDPSDERRPHVSPPNIRTTGELPAITGEIDRSAWLPPGTPASTPAPGALPPAGAPAHHHPDARPSDGYRGGSVVDRPPASPPDWMSGVDVPELIVTRDIGQVAPTPPANRAAEVAQHILALVLVALLVAAVALVAIGSIFGFR